MQALHTACRMLAGRHTLHSLPEIMQIDLHGPTVVYQPMYRALLMQTAYQPSQQAPPFPSPR